MALARQYVEQDFHTEAEYFAFEQTAFGRWEYVSGQIRLMAGGTDDHNTVAANIVRALGNALVPKNCRVYSADMKVHCGDGVNTFPDASAVCGARVYYQGRADVLTNPILIVEVLSPSTEKYDQGEKFEHYKTIPSLRDYLLVAQDQPRVMLYSHRNNHWDLQEAVGTENSVFLPSVEVTVALADVYALMEFTPDAPVGDER